MLIAALLTLGGHAAGIVRDRRALDWLAAPVRRGRGAMARRRSRAGAAQPAGHDDAVALPQGADLAGLLAVARSHFVRLQAAWDAGDVELLGQLTAPAVWRDLCSELPQRGAEANRTEVLTLQAQLLGCVEAPTAWLLSVEFSGMLREAADQGAAPFREWWMLVREKSPSPTDAEAPWRLLRQQTLL